ncbi:MAG: DNA starvation/stationary phase protection protein [Carnobacterium sp.]|uniref:Dps family protein n=1 Tax=unclassified Carnobacterium TaxID=257487 RepID=UPI00191336F1|nr:DNA starvation/stationary phase protection protein [Carnobacterium sp. CS13]QQP69947.1 DNA starvation/stationary phase protection protein [Carnobacterium sp. CS13]
MAQTNTEVQELLNDMVASHGVFITKLYQHHFYVQGPHFFTLHIKFEELYKETTEHFDELAERLIAIGGKPYATLKEFLEHSAIEEKPYTEKVPAEEMVASTVADYRILCDNLEAGIKLTGEAGDDVTQDLLIAYKTGVDKNIWMLQAFLGKDPLEGK